MAYKDAKRRITLGILAHVDAGKTTLSEAILYRTGELRKIGRVDHGDAFLDDSEIERNRGITVFSRQALFTAGPEGGKTEFTLIDTPGHVDFAAEMERALSVIDYAFLVVSGSEGVQAHTRTLYRLLLDRGIPVFVFINKMDIAVRQKEDLLAELADELGCGPVDFSGVLEGADAAGLSYEEILTRARKDAFDDRAGILVYLRPEFDTAVMDDTLPDGIELFHVSEDAREELFFEEFMDILNGQTEEPAE